MTYALVSQRRFAPRSSLGFGANAPGSKVASGWAAGQVSSGATRQSFAKYLKPASILEFLALQGFDPSKPVVFPKDIDEKLSIGERGKFHEERVFFLISELSKDAKFISQLSDASKLRWSVASAAAKALTDERLGKSTGLGAMGLLPAFQFDVSRARQSAQQQAQRAGQSIASAASGARAAASSFAEQQVSMARQAGENIGQSVASAVPGADAAMSALRGNFSELESLATQGAAELQQYIGDLPNEKELIDYLKSAGKPWLDELSKQAESILSDVAGPTMEVVDDVCKEIAPLIGPAKAVLDTVDAVIKILQRAEDEFKASVTASAKQSAQRNIRIADDLDDQCKQYIVSPLASELNQNVFPSDYFMPRKAAPLFAGYSPPGVKTAHSSERITVVPDIGRAMLAIASPSDLALESLQFVNLWSSARKTLPASALSGNFWSASFEAKPRASADQFASGLREWIASHGKLWINPWVYHQQRHTIVAQNAVNTGAWWSPAPKAGVLNGQEKFSGVNQDAFKAHGWLLSRPTLYEQPVHLSANESTRWATVPWSLRKVGQQIGGGYIFSHFNLYSKLWSAFNTGDVSSRCADNGLCLLVGYDGRAGKRMDETIAGFKTFLWNSGFQTLSAVAHQGLPTRWDPSGEWLESVKRNHAASESVEDSAGSIYRGKALAWYWPERGQTRPAPKPLAYGIQSEGPPTKVGPGDLLTYRVSPRTMSLFRMMHRLILEESSANDDLGQRIMPYFVDLLLYELNEGRITDESIASLLGAEFPTWDCNKSPRDQVYSFLHGWQAQNYPRDRDAVEKRSLAKKQVADIATLLVEKPSSVPAFMIKETGISSPVVQKLAKKYEGQKAKRLTYLQKAASAGLPAALRSLERKAKEEAKAKEDAKAQASGIPGWAIATVVAAAAVGGIWYVASKKKS